MNLPNKLTIFRIILIPFFVFFMLFEPELMRYRVIAEVIFCVASITDLLDGNIARKHNLVTNFGKFLDPLADKLLVCSALICLVANGQIDAWIVIIIIAREFIVSGLRQIAVEKGVVIAASWWGKWKTTFQMIMIIVLILNMSYYFAGTMFGTVMMYLEIVLIYIALALTIISMIDYFIKNKDILKESI